MLFGWRSLCIVGLNEMCVCECVCAPLFFFCVRICRSFPQTTQTTEQIQQINRRISSNVLLYTCFISFSPLFISQSFLYSQNEITALRFAKYLWSAAFWLSSIFPYTFDICLCMWFVVCFMLILFCSQTVIVVMPIFLFTCALENVSGKISW